MSVTIEQKKTIIIRAAELARDMANVNRAYNAFKEEYDAENYGGIIVTGDIDLTTFKGLTAAEWVDGVGAMDAVSTTIETNKTNLYRLASHYGSN